MLRKTRIVALLMVAVLVLTGNRAVYSKNVPLSLNDYDINTSETVNESFLANQENSSFGITNYIEYCLLAQKKSGKKVDTYTVDGVSSDYFPEYYGGNYINVYGNIVFEIVEDYYGNNFEKSELYRSIMSIMQVNSDNIVFRPVKVSYSKLVSIMNDLFEFVKQREIEEWVYGFGIDDYNNCIFVEVDKDIDRDYVLGIYELIGDVHCDIIYEKGYNSTNVNAYPGEGCFIYSGVYKIDFSIAFPAEIIDNGNHVNGFITAGHCFDDVNYQDVFSEYYVYLGEYHVGNRSYGGNADAAFFELADGVSPFYTVFSESTFICNEIRVQSQGSIVRKRGMTTGVTSGTVTSTSFTTNYPGTTITDMVKTSYDSDDGDSGGIVYSNPSTADTAYIAGVHSGNYKGWFSFLNYSIYTKAGNVITSLDVQLRE